MKKGLLALALAATMATAANAATVYFNAEGTTWNPVYVYSWSPSVEDVCTQVTVDGHELWKYELDNKQVIFRGAANWNNGQTVDLTVVDGAVFGADNIKGAGNSNAPIATIENGKYLVGGEAPVYEITTIGLIGAQTGWSSDIPMTKVSDNVWTLTTDIAGEFKLRANGEWIKSWGQAGNPNITENGVYPVTDDNGGNFTCTANNVTLTLDIAENTLTVSGMSGDTPTPPVDYSNWYVNVLGNFNEWKDNGVQPVDGISTTENLEIGTSEFKIKIWDGTSDVWYSTGAPVATDEWVKIDGNNDVNMTVAGAAEGDIFTVSFNCATNEIKVVKTGQTGVASVETAAEALYFNLQGARVANPEAGLYIRVINGKAQKVVVK